MGPKGGGSPFGAFEIGRVIGIPIRIHVTFLLLLVWYGLASSRRGDDPWLSVLFLLLVFTCVVLHELGHAWVARRFGVRTREILVYPMGGLARLENLPTGAAELWIALAGPAVNVLLFLALLPWALFRLQGLNQPLGEPGQLVTRLALANLLLFVFNLLPAFPMDGGRVLRALLTMAIGADRATRVASGIGQVIAIGFGLVGILVPAPLLLLVAWFVFIGAGQERGAQRRREWIAAGTAREAMVSQFETLSPQDSLAEASRSLARSQQQDYPVIDAWDRVAGVLSRTRILEGLAQQGGALAVLEVMDRSPLVVPPETTLDRVFERFRSRTDGAVLVLDGDRLLGMITLEQLVRYLERSRRGAPDAGGEA